MPLTGGFGNQLFQLAFCLFLIKVRRQRAIIDVSLGKPRKNVDVPAILGIIPDDLKLMQHFSEFTESKFFTKVYGWNLNRALAKREKQSYFAKAMSIASNALFTLRYRKTLSTISASDIGYDQKLEMAKAGIYIGYFQTYKFASVPEVFDILMRLEISEPSRRYKEVLGQAETTKPIMLHIRLTDYLSESKFGIPSLDYYRSAIRTLRETGNNSPIWVFSDDNVKALNIAKAFYEDEKLEFFDEPELNDLEVWSVMRNCSGFILANSTFSWWAAFLRYHRESIVCCPKPWFRDLGVPNALIPEDWISVSHGK